MITTYQALTRSRAVDAGAPEALVVDLCEPGELIVENTGVFRLTDGVPVELLGADGGEPEDQTLGRDWRWVVGALTAAYGHGYADGQMVDGEGSAA